MRTKRVQVLRTRSEFTLCRSEAAELNRAIRLFDQARDRLEELQRQSSTRRLWPVLLNLDADRAADLEERHDLEAYAAHLRATIRQLKRRPLQRLRSWVHLISTHDALAGAIAVYFIGLAFAITASNFVEEVSLFLANGAVAALAAMAALLIYPVQQARLRRQHDVEFHAFRDLARSDVRPPLQEEAPDQAAADETSSETDTAGNWSAVLGVPPAAAIDDIKQAYKVLIKQSRPRPRHVARFPGARRGRNQADQRGLSRGARLCAPARAGISRRVRGGHCVHAGDKSTESLLIGARHSYESLAVGTLDAGTPLSRLALESADDKTLILHDPTPRAPSYR